MQTTLRISGMKCDGCLATVVDAVRSVPGVEEVHVDLPEGRARIEHAKNVDLNELVAAIHRKGFESEIAER